MTLKNTIGQLIPRSMMPLVRYVYYFPKDTWDLLLGRRDELTPPTRLMFVGTRDITVFKKNGEEHLRYFIELGELKPDEKVLDVGCGIGRKAVPLTRYLNNIGEYEGFDIVKEGIDWCNQKISKKYPNFQFQLADMFNSQYNPQGRFKAYEYRFPYEDGYFDFVFLTSVFTHMLPEDVENYFSEITRVLKKDGRCFITFFLGNDASLELLNGNKSSLDFKYRKDKYLTVNTNIPEIAVCYDEPFILDLYEKYGLNIKTPIHYGSWCGRTDSLSYQDIIIATKM
jgi:ubiquinone/menaquinone biosynthesis C-methylase UbiE